MISVRGAALKYVLAVLTFHDDRIASISSLARLAEAAQELGERRFHVNQSISIRRGTSIRDAASSPHVLGTTAKQPECFGIGMRVARRALQGRAISATPQRYSWHHLLCVLTLISDKFNTDMCWCPTGALDAADLWARPAPPHCCCTCCAV